MTSLTDAASSLKSLLLFGGLMLLGTLALVWLGTPRGKPAIGQSFPAMDLRPLVHTEATPKLEELSGKVVLLHFWGTWCPPCRREFPEFVEVAEKYKDDPRVVIISVSCSGGPEYNLDELKQETESFLIERAPGMATYCDPAAMTRGQLAMLLAGGTMGYPTTVLIDSEGKIAEVLAGYLPGEMEKISQRIALMLK